MAMKSAEQIRAEYNLDLELDKIKHERKKEYLAMDHKCQMERLNKILEIAKITGKTPREVAARV